MLFEEFTSKYILADGRVLRLVCDFEKRIAQVRLSARKREGKAILPCTIDVEFREVFEIDLLDTFGLESYSDVVFVKTEVGQFYASFDPYGNSGFPIDKDNFVIKSDEVWLKADGGELRLE